MISASSIITGFFILTIIFILGKLLKAYHLVPFTLEKMLFHGVYHVVLPLWILLVAMINPIEAIVAPTALLTLFIVLSLVFIPTYLWASWKLKLQPYTAFWLGSVATYTDSVLALAIVYMLISDIPASVMFTLLSIPLFQFFFFFIHSTVEPGHKSIYRAFAYRYGLIYVAWIVGMGLHYVPIQYEELQIFIHPLAITTATLAPLLSGIYYPKIKTKLTTKYMWIAFDRLLLMPVLTIVIMRVLHIVQINIIMAIVFALLTPTSSFLLKLNDITFPFPVPVSQLLSTFLLLFPISVLFWLILTLYFIY